MKYTGFMGALALGLFVGCDDANVVQVQEEFQSGHTTVMDSVIFDGGAKGTLQGTIYDGLTGERLGDSLEMYLIVGTDHRVPNKLVSDPNSILEGEYAYTEIPITSDDYYSNSVKLVVKRQGYHEFVSEFSYVTDDEDFNEYLSRIGNVYLYPESQTSQDLDVITLCGELPCKDANVHLQQLSSLDDLSAISSTVSSPTSDVDLGSGRDTRLYPTLGIYPKISAVTNSQGIASFKAEDIILGARYQVVVDPVVGKDSSRYVQVTGADFVAGVTASSSQQSITMVAGYATAPVVTLSASTEKNNGKVAIELNRPVVIVDDGVDASVTTDSPNALSVDSVTVQVSTDGRTITLVPVFNRTLEDSETITITYTEDADTPISYHVLGYEEGNDPELLFDLGFLKTFSFQKP